MEQQEMKQLFMESAVHVVARDGLEKATTKAIAAQAGLNEAYIYKCFRGKDQLLSAAFHQEDENFAAQLRQNLPLLHLPGIPPKERLFLYWQQIWQFILEKPDDCIFYIRYYYSADCRVHAYEEHLRQFHELIQRARYVFKPQVNVDILVHQIFDTMLAFAARVMNAEMDNSPETTRWAFEQIYRFVEPNVQVHYVQEEG